MTDKELAAALELAQTRLALVQTNFRALRAEMALAEVGAQEINAQIKALMVEQEERAKPAPAPVVEEPKAFAAAPQ